MSTFQRMQRLSRGISSLLSSTSSTNSYRYSYSTNTKFSQDKVCLDDKYGKFTLQELTKTSHKLSKDLLANFNKTDLQGEKIAVLCANNYSYLVSCMAIWQANGVPLGLNKLYPANLIEYFLKDSNCKLAINGIPSSRNGSNEMTESEIELSQLLDRQRVTNYKLDEANFVTLSTEHEQREDTTDYLKQFRDLLSVKDKESMILYTSGTSGPPKGVVLTSQNLKTTIETIIQSWEIDDRDTLLHVLPLNHVHGLIYGLLTFVYAGARVDILPKFDVERSWSKLIDTKSINSFMAVPTVYVQLVNAYLNPHNAALREKYPRELVQDTFHDKIRLVVSGSAPLNVKTYKEWNDITGYKILERYGMTEIGLGLSNPYRESDEQRRVAGAVGRPCGKESRVRIVDTTENDWENVLVESSPTEDWKISTNSKKELFGELQIKSEMVFKEYLNKKAQTEESFTKDGWFRTGDTAEFLRDSKIYKLIGRTSVDVIKSGGYKISALDVEKEVLAHDMIDDVAVMGLSDPVWGQRVFALIVLKQEPKKRSDTNGHHFNEEEFKAWCKKRLPKHQVPSLIKVIPVMPRNQIGKVNKKELIKIYEKEFGSDSQ